jgi:hypothetical protein
MKYKTLNVQIDPILWAALAAAAELGAVTKKNLVEAMIAQSAGIPHKAERARVSGWNRFRRQGRLLDIKEGR